MIEAHPPVALRHVAADSSNLDDMFEMFFGGSRPTKAIGMRGDIGWRPATDVYETEDEFIIQMDLAGMAREGIEVLVDESFVIVKGTRGNIAPAGKKHFHKMEILVGPFERHLRIPDEIDGTTAKARYQAGFLFVVLRRGSGRCAERRSVSIAADRS
jgi:HSP20 family protein